jgi:membrane glycosyltransferase
MALFLSEPLWVGLLVFGALNALAGGGATTPPFWLAALLLTTWAALFAPKLSGYAEVLLKPRLAARYGGRAVFLRGVLAELAFTLVFTPVSTVNKTLFLLALPFGRGTGWAPQNRAERGVAWADAARLLWRHTLVGALVFTPLLAWAPGAALWALPFAGGLLLAMPFCVLTASPRFSALLRRHRLAATPEELGR